ncbi:MAG: hypothetical protein AAF340_06520 [Pseudomonadota bacterium]
MPLTKLVLLLTYVLIAAALTIFLVAQLSPEGNAAQVSAVLLPLAMLAGIAIRALHKRLGKDDT